MKDINFVQMISDMVAIAISYLIAIFIKFRLISPEFFSAIRTRQLFFIIFAAFFLYSGFRREDIKKKNHTFSEQMQLVFRQSVGMFVILISVLFMFKMTGTYSRQAIAFFFVFYYFISLLLRMLSKNLAISFGMNNERKEKVVLIGKYDLVQQYLINNQKKGIEAISVSGVIITDVDCKNEYLEKTDIISNREEMYEDILSYPSDSVFIITDQIGDDEREMIQEFVRIGKLTRIDINESYRIGDIYQSVSEWGGRDIISYSPVKIMSSEQRAMKRLVDVVLALLLVPLFLVFAILSLIFTNIESRGPLFTTCVRVSRNGRLFQQYRFRTLRMDYAKRAAQGERTETAWGRIIRRLYINRLPLILNVLFGDMSFVGPHAPSFSRYLEYSTERRKNLSIWPGIIGDWSLTDNEDEIIQKERKYIAHWNIFRDISIIFEMFARIITRTLPRKDVNISFGEERQFVSDTIANNQPFAYPYSYTKRPNAFYLLVKRMVDIILSLAGIIVLSPLFVILSIVIIFNDGGKPIYGHQRIGKDGKRIKIWKFRSMSKNAGEVEKLLTPEQLIQYKTEFKVDNDPRITAVGEFLRKTSLDELPQLFNILNGTMSIVGPRPIVEEETVQYGEDIAKLLSVTPGLTGYWQAYARNNATYESGERQAMEMYYVDHASLWFDIKILFRTVYAVIKRDGAQ